MAGRPICLLIFLMPSPRLELRTPAGYKRYNDVIPFTVNDRYN